MADGYIDPSVYSAQRRSSVFDALLQRSMQPQDIRSPLQGLAGMGNTILSAYLANKGWGDVQQAQTAANEQRASHLKSAFGDQGNPVVDALMGNADTAGVGEQLMVANATRQPQRGFFDQASGRFLDAQGNIIHEYGPSATGATSGVGKIEEDFKAGRIDKPTRDALIRKETYIAPTGGADAGAWENVPPDGIKALGLNPGTVAQRNSRTGAIEIRQKGQDTAEVGGPFGGKGLPAQAMDILIAGKKRIAAGLPPEDPDAYQAALEFMTQPKSNWDPSQGQVVTTKPQYGFPAYSMKPGEAATGLAAMAAPEEGAPRPAPTSSPDPAPDAPQTTQVTPNVSVTQVPGKSPGTPAQLQIAGYRDRLTESDKVISQLNDAGTSYTQQGLSHVPMIGNALKSDDRQKLEQAERDFTNANLRRESGAAINESEFTNAAQQYFPQPGDSAAVLEQKARNRATVLNNFKREAGRVPELAGPSDASHPAPPPGFQVLP